MNIAYSYVTLRYVHDIVTGEFVNIGIVVYAPDQDFLRARFATNCGRLNAMFGQIDEAHFKATIEYLADAFDALSRHLEFETRDICELVRRVLPDDDSSLQWSEPGGGLAQDPVETLNSLFSRFIERYTQHETALQ